MANTPGRYDDLAREILDRTKAEAVMLIVINGNRGTGGSGAERRPWDVVMREGSKIKRALPGLLRRLALYIEGKSDSAFIVDKQVLH